MGIPIIKVILCDITFGAKWGLLLSEASSTDGFSKIEVSSPRSPSILFSTLFFTDWREGTLIFFGADPHMLAMPDAVLGCRRLGTTEPQALSLVLQSHCFSGKSCTFPSTTCSSFQSHSSETLNSNLHLPPNHCKAV